MLLLRHLYIQQYILFIECSEVVLKYLILGAIPPPLGGVSVYCMRRLDVLEKRGEESYFFDSRKKSNLLRLILFSWYFRIKGMEQEIEVNVSNVVAIFILTLFGLAKHSVFFDHNSSRRLFAGKVQAIIFSVFCEKAKKIKLVNKDLIRNYDKYVKLGHEKVIVESPFLPPSSEEIEISRCKFPDHAKYLLEGDDRNIVLTTAWMPVSNETEVDLYGLKDSLLIYRALMQKHPDIIFMMMIGKLDDTGFSREILELMNELDGFTNFEFIQGGFSQLPLLPRTLALLRLTKTDGDSVSVHEALHFGASVIATNVSVRPNSVELVPVGDRLLTKQLLENLINKRYGT